MLTPEDGVQRDSRQTFNELMGNVDYPMLIVTTAVEEERAGCLVGFATQCSIDPPRFLVCLSEKNRTFALARASGALAVHFPGQDRGDLVELFGGETGDEIDKFSRCEWREGPGGAPILTELENWFAGRVLETLPFGDHCGFLLEPIDGETSRSNAPLTFRRAKWIEPGHEP
jgi:flavin reductase (DIM6/NTAB) family NADH-FMN oxidoreductase RutF